MIRSLGAILAGQLSITLLNGFTRLVVAIYFRSDIQLSGVMHLPSPFWQYAIIGLNIAFGMFGGLITCSIVRKNYGMEILVLILLIVTMGLFEFQVLGASEPIWYLILSPLSKAAGVWGGYRIKSKQDEKLSST